MTEPERHTLRQIIHTARVAQVEAQGGYTAVEKDARELDQRIAGVGRGQYARHGSPNCYRRGCRRPVCVDAYRSYQREWARTHRPLVAKGPVGFASRTLAAA